MIWWAMFEHRRFTLEAFGATEQGAKALLLDAWKQWCVRNNDCYGDGEDYLEKNWDDDVQVRQVGAGSVLLDGEEYAILQPRSTVKEKMP